MKANHRAARLIALLLFGAAAGGLGLLPSTAQAADPALVGAWGPVRSLPWRPVHSIMLPTGKVMFYPSTDDPILWDPLADTLTDLPRLGYSPFCSGHSLMADGRVLITSGSETDLLGLPNASIFDPVTNTFTALPHMNGGRWYPTLVTLGNGDVVTISGNKEDGTRNTIPQVWQASSNSWRDLTGADLSLELYPAAFLASSGKVFLATSTSRYLDTAGTGSWTTVAKRNVGGRDNYGSAAMYDVDKVIYTGGGRPPVASTEIISLSAATPAWKKAASMPQARRQHNITILPDATLLVTGGSSADGANIDDGPKPAINYNAATNNWTTWAMPVEYRGYHSEAVLLPDARVAVIGGNNHPNLEIFSPPYLFKGPQPVISSAPANVTYGEPFFVGTPDAASITNVNLIRLSAVTHTKNMNQRINRNLVFSQTNGGLNITPPSSSNRCPPGDYMLFLLNADGVPSVAKIIRINNAAAGNSAPTTAISQPAGGATFTAGDPVTFTGTAADNEDGDLTASLNWSSSIDGAIGNGGSFSTSTLSAGIHTVTASATDSGSLVGAASISVTINTAGGGSGPITAHQWHFDETSGTTAADSAGTNNATLTNVSWVAGNIGNAAAFNGTNTWGDAGKIDFGTSNFTVAHWVKVDTFKSFAGIFNNRDSASGNIGFHTRTDSSGTFKALIDFGAASKNLAFSNAAPGTWYHVAVSVDRAGLMKLYVNGTLSGQVDIAAFSAVSLSHPDNVRLGRDQGSNYFSGAIDELRLYNSALSAEAILNLYTTAGSVPGNSAPTTAISQPADGAAFTAGDPITFTGTAADNEDGDLTASLNWSSSIDGAIGSGGSFSTATLSAGTHTITASATDSGSLVGSDTITVTVNAAGNTVPTAAISEPADGATFTAGDPITFTGTAADNEDGDLTASLNWSSSIDGAIGSGGSFSTATLSAGTHTITAAVTDSGSLVGSDTITVTVNAVGGGPLPAHQWHFDESSGTTAVDSAGTNNATLTNVAWVAGNIGNAAAFNGTNTWGDAGKIDFGTSNFTVAHWVKVDTFKSFAGIFNNRDSASGNIGFHTRTDSSGTFKALIDFGAASKNLAFSNAVPGIWYHVAVSVDRAGLMKLYVNGTLSGQVDIAAFSAVSLSHPDNVRLGRDQGSNYFSGAIDELRLYNSALSEEAILNLYNE